VGQIDGFGYKSYKKLKRIQRSNSKSFLLEKPAVYSPY